MSARIVSVRLAAEEDVVGARQCAREVARELGFDQQDQIRIATAVSELARNVVSYAGDGNVEFTMGEESAPSLIVNVKDHGKGIPNLQAILDGTYQSSTGMGKGIVGVRRLMDRFHIETGPSGTFVTVEKQLPRSARRLAASDLSRIAQELACAQATPVQELRQQNADLLQALAELTTKSDELEELTSELENTNRGVVALHAELEATAAQLRRASDLKTRFLSNVSHEFRTPLNSILALSRLLLDRTDGDLSQEQERQVRFISDAAISLTELVNDLLDIAKVEAGKTDIKPVRFTIYDLFGALRGLLRPLKTSDSVELVFEEPVGVPILFNDEGKITQILRNLISNALKFTQQGEVRVSAEFREPDRVLFCVRDTGIGIPKQYHDRIFEEFEQVPHALQARAKGTGLGLPLSRRLAQLLHGSVAVDSTPDVGSSFFLDIPVRWSVDGETTPSFALERTSGRPRVLIADDEEAFRYVIRRMIDSQQYDIVEASDGEEVLALVAASQPDVIILDINMPKRDGYDVLDELGANPDTRDIPVVVSTSMVLSERDRSRLARSRAVLAKESLSVDTVRTVLTDVLQSHRAST